MNETLHLAIETNPLALIAAGALVWTIMFGWLIAKVGHITTSSRASVERLSKEIACKDFSFKPKFSERNGGLEVSEHRYSPGFPPIMWL